MIGALFGDVVGSRFEWNNHRSKKFELLSRDCFFTDDSVMSIAVCDALLRSRPDFADLAERCVESMQRIGRPYPDCGYGASFFQWMYDEHPRPYNSYGNGAAMRVSACAYVARSLAEVLRLAGTVTAVTHNHPEGMKGAAATAAATFLALEGKSLREIRAHVVKNYYPLDFTLDEIRETYRFNETCQETVPQALQAFFESVSFEDALRNAVSVGGDSDTLAAITGAVAEAYYGVPASLRRRLLSYLDARLLSVLTDFERRYPPRRPR